MIYNEKGEQINNQGKVINKENISVDKSKINSDNDNLNEKITTKNDKSITEKPHKKLSKRIVKLIVGSFTIIAAIIGILPNILHTDTKPETTTTNILEGGITITGDNNTIIIKNDDGYFSVNISTPNNEADSNSITTTISDNLETSTNLTSVTSEALYAITQTSNIITTSTTTDTTTSTTTLQHNNTSSEKTLYNKNVELIIHNSDSCTGYISNDYINKNYIGKTSGDYKIIGWSIYMRALNNNMLIAAQLDWENNKEGLRGVGIYENEGTIQEGIFAEITNDGLIIELDSENLPFDLNEVDYIEIQDICEKIN